jgi:hypothetical protein
MSMKYAYMLQSKRNKQRFLLQEMDPCWTPARLAYVEQADTYGQHFVCETKKGRAKELAERWNEAAGPNGEQVVPVRVLRGFVMAKPRTAKNDFMPPPGDIANDLVWRCDVYRMLHNIGGTGAEEHSWEAGWDKAVDTAIDELKEMEGAC